MSSIELTVSDDTIRMVWGGQVTAQDIYQSFRQLVHILKDSPDDMNLIVLVDATTQLPLLESFDGMPTALSNVKLRDSLIIGKNAKVNHAISTMLSLIIPPSTQPHR